MQRQLILAERVDIQVWFLDLIKRTLGSLKQRESLTYQNLVQRQHVMIPMGNLLEFNINIHSFGPKIKNCNSKSISPNKQSRNDCY